MSEPVKPLATRPITVVTGGSEGIGLAIARRFAAKGHEVLLVAREAEKLATAAASIRAHPQARGGDVAVHVLSLDLTRPDAPQVLETSLAVLGGYAHIIVNSAGIGLSGAFATRPHADVEALVALNIVGLTRLIRHFVPQMQHRRAGGFLNLASLGGYVPGPYQAVYYASKAYVISLSEALAVELRADRVRVTVVAPGPVETRFHARMGAEASLYRRLLPAPGPEYVAWFAVTGFALGTRVVVPGILSLVMFVALRLLPHRLVIPAVAMLLKPRGQEGHDA